MEGQISEFITSPSQFTVWEAIKKKGCPVSRAAFFRQAFAIDSFLLHIECEGLPFISCVFNILVTLQCQGYPMWPFRLAQVAPLEVLLYLTYRERWKGSGDKQASSRVESMKKDRSFFFSHFGHPCSHEHWLPVQTRRRNKRYKTSTIFSRSLEQ